MQRLTKNGDESEPPFIEVSCFKNLEWPYDEKYLFNDETFTVYLIQSNTESSPQECYNIVHNNPNNGNVCFKDTEAVECFQLDLSQANGSKNDLQADIYLRKLPEITVSSQIDTPITDSTTTGYCLLLELADGNEKYYGSIPLQLTSSDIINNYQTIPYFVSPSDSSKIHYYTGSEVITAYLVPGTSSELSNLVNENSIWYGNGALTVDGYRVTSLLSNYNLHVDLKKQTLTTGSDHNVEIHFYGADYQHEQYESPRFDNDKKYYVLATLKQKDVEDAPVIAYCIKEFTTSNVRAETTGIVDIVIKGTQTDASTSTPSDFRLVDAKGHYLEQTIPYDPSKLSMSVRLYQKQGNNLPSTLSDAMSGSDTLDHYDFMSNVLSSDENTNIIKLHSRYDKTYQVELDFDTPIPQFDQNDHIYLLVKLEHETTQKNQHRLVKLMDIPTSSESNTKKIITISDNEWQDNNGNQESYSFTGNEKATVRIIKATNDINMNVALSGENCSIIPEGGLVKDYTVSFSKQRNVEEKQEGDKYTAVITDYVTFSKIEATNDYSYSSILGNGVYYGITANKIVQTNHMQTNFATNYYDGVPYGVDPDLAGSGGAIVIADGKINNGKLINIGEKSCRGCADLYGYGLGQ